MGNKITLQENQSCGGEVAEGGFEFQNNIILSFIPSWLKDNSFDGFVRESMGDFEIKFFRSDKNGNFIFDFLETKNHIVRPKEFWSEIERFKKMDEESSGMYRYFMLASTGVSTELKPLAKSLRRIKGPYHFYGSDSDIVNNSLTVFREQIKKMGRDEKDANFIFEKVIIKDDFGAIQSQGEAIFIQSLSVCFPELGDLSHQVKQIIFSSLKSLIGGKCNVLIDRKELEQAIRNCINSSKPSFQILPKVFTSIDDICEEDSINLKWSEFWGGDERKFPNIDLWNKKMLPQLQDVKEWIVPKYNIRRILISGNRRLSTAIAIGSIFSATSGFDIDFNFRGSIWSTDKHATDQTPEYELVSKMENRKGDDVAVSIGIIHNILGEVNTFLESNSMQDISRLSIFGEKPITSPDQANKVVQEIKKIINNYCTETGSKNVHLFFAGPSFLALFLGHRLNATANIICYERISSNKYVQTCSLKCS